MNLYPQIIRALDGSADPVRAAGCMRYFKVADGQYGAGDIFIGITVPDQRIIAKKFRDASVSDITKLLHSKIHEHRLTALLILDLQYAAGGEMSRGKSFAFAAANTRYINNWDLVDTIARDIFGHYIFNYYNKTQQKKFLDSYITSSSLWEQRIAVVACHYQISKQNSGEMILYVAKKLLSHKHDLIHKAIGWMLRELGKTSTENEKLLEDFLQSNYNNIPRTTLRYAIERFSESKRKWYLAGCQ